VSLSFPPEAADKKREGKLPTPPVFVGDDYTITSALYLLLPPLQLAEYREFAAESGASFFFPPLALLFVPSASASANRRAF